MIFFSDVGAAQRIADVAVRAIRQHEVQIPVWDQPLTVGWFEGTDDAVMYANAEACRFVGDKHAQDQLRRWWLARGDRHKFEFTKDGGSILLIIEADDGLEKGLVVVLPLEK